MSDHVLRPEIVRELNQVSHFGHAPRVRELVTEAGQAIEEERYEDAIEPLLQAKTKAPRSTYVRELLGIAFYRLERWREAARELAAYRRLSDRRDRDPEYADSERALGRPEKAVEVLSFKDPSAGKVGPVAWQMHNPGLFDEFKDVTIEADPQEHDLITLR